MFLQSWLFPIEDSLQWLCYLSHPSSSSLLLSLVSGRALPAQQLACPTQHPQLLCSPLSTFGSLCRDQDLGMCFTLGSVFFSMVLFITYSFFPSSLFIQAYNSHPPTVGISEGSCLVNGRVFLPVCFVSVVVLSLLKSLFLALLRFPCCDPVQMSSFTFLCLFSK